MNTSYTVELLSWEDVNWVMRIITGCAKHVYRYMGPEDQWYNRVTDYKHRIVKPSKKILAEVSIINSKMNSQSTISPKQLVFNLSDNFEDVDHSTASLALSDLAEINYLQKNQFIPRKKPGRLKGNDTAKSPGPESSYTLSDNVQNLKKFVERIIPRQIIYTHLVESAVLEQFLKFHHCSRMIIIKHSNLGDWVRIQRAKGVDEKSLDELKQKFVNVKELVNKKDEKEIRDEALKMAKEDLNSRDWKHDKLYTEFFINGGLCYPVVEAN